MIQFRIYGSPVPQGRPRAFHRPGLGTRVYDPSNSKKWKEDVRLQALNHKQTLNGSGYVEGPVDIELTFFMPRPKSLPKKVKHHIKKPDIDNLQKAVKDGLKGVYFKDDSQIVTSMGRKVYCEEGMEPGVEVIIRPAEAPA